MHATVPKRPLILLGAGPFASTLLDFFERNDDDLPFELAGFAQNVEPDRKDERLEGFRVYSLNELPEFAATHEALCILGEPESKRRFVEQAEAMGFRFATFINPEASHSRKCEIGEGSLVGRWAMTFRNSKIGKHCTILGQSIVGDQNELGDYVFLSAGVKLSGDVKVGSNTFLGAGAIVTERVSIGSNAIVGAGAVVIRDVPDGAVVVGNPAREIPRKGLFKPRPA